MQDTSANIKQKVYRYTISEIPIMLESSLKDSSCISWFNVQAIINRHLKEYQTMQSNIRQLFSRSIYNISNLLTLLYVFKLCYYNILIDRVLWKDTVFKNRWYQYETILIWLYGQHEHERTESLYLTIGMLPYLLNKTYLNVYDNDIKFLLYCFNQLIIRTQKHIELYLRFVLNLGKMHVISATYSISMVIIRISCYVIYNIEKYRGTGNMAMIFDEFLLYSSYAKNIVRFVSHNMNYFEHLPAYIICHIFAELTRSSINTSIIYFLTILSNHLAYEEQFFILRMLYQRIVLPVLIRRAKACLKFGVAEYLVKLARIYIIGFSQYCHIGSYGLDCMLQDIILAEYQKIRNYWLKLCFFLLNKMPYHRLDALVKLKYQGLYEKLLTQIYKTELLKISSDEVWYITTRNYQRRRIYPHQKSYLKGIKNYANQCYIISIMQALYSIQEFRELLRRTSIRGRSFVKEIAMLFDQLTERRYYISVNDLKRAGPATFANSFQQYDCQQYFMYLFDLLQKYLKVFSPSSYQALKSIFLINQYITIKCSDPSCSYNEQIKYYSFVHTIPNNQTFQVNVVEYVEYSQCMKCKLRNCQTIRVFEPVGKVFFLHLNRFSHINGVIRKELATQKIPRVFMGYELIGIVFHIGKNVQTGHYIYYQRVGAKRWAEMNDNQVFEFELSAPDEYFYTQMKAYKTPYLLLYRRPNPG